MKTCPSEKCDGVLKSNGTDNGPDVIIRYWVCKKCGRRFKGTQLPEQLAEIPHAEEKDRR